MSKETAKTDSKPRIARHHLPGDVVQLKPEARSEKFLGAGAQYSVYDRGDGRVRKIPHGIKDSMAAIAQWHKGSEIEIADYAKHLAETRQKSADHVRRITRDNPKARAFFGNPRFEDDGTIIQDKVEVLADVLKKYPEKSDDLLLKYVGSVKQSWKYGCFDLVYNMANNTGVKNDEIVMMDFGEIGTDKSWMHGIIDERKWEDSYDYQHVLDGEQAAFVRGAARAMLTHDALDQRWQADFPH
ncbi:hypothetical protein BH09PAT3_BH09PAT3_6500 [soil metagenome]